MATLTVYPAAGSGSTTVDGFASETGAYTNFTDIRNAAGDSADVSGGDLDILLITDPSANFSGLGRGFFTFDTSSLTNATITSATFEFVNKNKFTNGTAPDLILSNMSLAAVNNIVGGDYDSIGRTSYGDVAYVDVGAGYTSITMNASGLANINKSGISQFSLQLSYDFNNSFVGSLNTNDAWGFRMASRDDAGTITAPKLVINYNPTISKTETIAITDEQVKKTTKTFADSFIITDFFQVFSHLFSETITVIGTFASSFTYIQTLIESTRINDTRRILKNGINTLWGKIQRSTGSWSKITRK